MPKGSVKKINKKKTKRIRKTNKKNLDKYIGKVVLLKLPNNKRKRYFWIVRKKNDRYIIRSPKTGGIN